jgi:hypothetical protein
LDRGAGAALNHQVYENTSIGGGAGDATTEGAYNTSIGYASLGANTTASSNTAVGYRSFNSSNTTGDCIT